MFKKLLILAVLSAIGFSAHAFYLGDIQNWVPLKDGSTVYIFKDGKMAMEDKYGNAVSMKEGEVMEAKNGQKITMQGNEVGRLAAILRDKRNPFL